MDILLSIAGLFFILLGLIGAFLPVLPGPPTSWVGLLFLQLTEAIPTDWTFLWTTLGIALLVTFLDYVIPPLGTKKFGGSKKGVWGSTLGLIVGLFFGPIGIIFGPFLGALAGELIHDATDTNRALKAAFGSFVGFLLSTGLKFTVASIYAYYFIADMWSFKGSIFTF